MLFRDLCQINKTWSNDTHIFVLNGSSRDADDFLLKTAVALYGACEVMWFRGDVVMLV